MPFTTIDYIAFFAILFFAYYAIPRRFQWGLLLVGSLVFYGWMVPSYLIFLLTTVVITYAGAVGMDHNLQVQKTYIKAQGKALDREAKKAYKASMEHRRKWMLGGVIFGLMAMLGTFKYGQFVVDNFCAVLGWVGVSTLNSQPSTLCLILPIGLSFYIFQSLGYCIDVFREEVPAERNFFKHTLYISFFPQVMQGPIGTYSTLKPQLFDEHAFDYNQAKFGLQRIAWGFFKKWVIANRIARYVDPAWTNVDGYSGFATWFFFCALYAVQLYADFSGYMDIACGCSQMLGIKLDENFETPYFAKSIAHFWRKWHITLGTWFKNYVFYSILRTETFNNLRKSLSISRTSALNSLPLTYNKFLSTALPTSLALLVVWFLIGLWHGAAWSYIVYGLFHGAFIIAAVCLQPVYDRFHAQCPRIVSSRAYAVWQVTRTFAIVVVGYSIFKPADLSLTAQIWSSSTAFGWKDFVEVLTKHPLGWVMCLGWTGVLLAIDLVHLKFPVGSLRAGVGKLPRCLRWGIYLAGVWIVVFLGLYGAGLEQFEYFKF